MQTTRIEIDVTGRWDACALLDERGIEQPSIRVDGMPYRAVATAGRRT